MWGGSEVAQGQDAALSRGQRGGGHGLVAESPDCGTAGWAAVLALPGSSQGLLIHL